MIVKNGSKLQRKHPNYNEEIEIIKILVDCCVLVLNTDLLDCAQTIGNIDWNVVTKNYFLSCNPKEVHCEDINLNNKGFSELYEKSGFRFSVSINHPTLIETITLTRFFDYMSIFQMGNRYTVRFQKENEFNGMFEIEAQNGNPVLLSYDITIKNN